MRTQAQINAACNSLLIDGPAPTDESEEIREAFERIRVAQARTRIELQEAGPQEIAIVRNFLDSQRAKILEKFPRPE